MDLPQYTKSQLALRNGSEMDEIWIAFEGKIYDMTSSVYWKKGSHYGNFPGQDLTEELSTSPHGRRVFENLTPIGELK
ncbi:MAG: cytochrome b5 domain-containing protein [Bacteroidales bacterium]|nr:cytochrome b5 domain-containing protein [Bacteroidales bacterium]